MGEAVGVEAEVVTVIDPGIETAIEQREMHGTSSFNLQIFRFLY